MDLEARARAYVGAPPDMRVRRNHEHHQTLYRRHPVERVPGGRRGRDRAVPPRSAQWPRKVGQLSSRSGPTLLRQLTVTRPSAESFVSEGPHAFGKFIASTSRSWKSRA